MFRKKTLIVVGAGASSEVGLPLGTALAEQISKLLYFEFDVGRLQYGDHEFLNGLQRHFRDNQVVSKHLKAARRISEGVRLVNSIDNYIDAHRDDEFVARCGKAAITYSILRAERASRLFVDSQSRKETIPFDLLEASWLVPFARYLVQEVPVSDVDNLFANLKIICFNYDRCIEEFLSFWIERVYNIDRSRARELASLVDIIRPYGMVGSFLHPGRMSGIAFGREPADFDFLEVSSSLLTYTEQIEDQDLVGDLRSSVAEAETIIFLGFAFHPQNMKLLSPSKKTNARRVFASAFGFSDSDASEIHNELSKMFLKHEKSTARSSQLRQAIHVRNDLKCCALLTEYSRTIAPARSD